MKRLLTTAFLNLLTIGLFAQGNPKPFGAIPSKRQLDWQELEMYCIVHLGMATYTDKEWAYGDENPSLFNPVNFDATSIVTAAKAGGFKGIVVVAKHHDGFCLWPTKTTPHNISKSPYKNGMGDIVGEYQIACKKLGMKMGIYCSPWDRNSSFYGRPEYVKNIYTEQLKELYANYGNFFVSWHDGANGGDGYYGDTREVRKIDNSKYYGWGAIWSVTRAMQPGAVIFGDVGPDVRWVGNEEGEAGKTSWATYTPMAPDIGKEPASGYSKYWLATEGTKNGKYWMPAECNVPMRPGWFYHSSQNGKSKSAYELLELYYKSVGRGACLDLGLSPDASGRLTLEDSEILKQFGDILKETFKSNLLNKAKFFASNVRGKSKKFSTRWLIDNDRYTYWATDEGQLTPEVIAEIGSKVEFNVIRLRENIKLGQRITAFAVDVFTEGQWREVAGGTSIGANKLIRLDRNVSTNRVRLHITGSNASVALSDFALFKEPSHLLPLQIVRDGKGSVTISAEEATGNIHYTLDGTEPIESSIRYTKSFDLNKGGTVKARSFEKNGKFSAIATKDFGLSKQGWKITEEKPQSILSKNLEAAIDESEQTIATSLPENDRSAQVADLSSISIDMGRTQTIKSFLYLPRQDKRLEGIVSRYAFFISKDGLIWEKVKEGEFANIKSNPIEQIIPLETPKPARYFRMAALSILNGNTFTIAEVGVKVK